MNADIKAQWTAALRSGDYLQGEGYLRFSESFCCLGVLCDLAAKAGTVTVDVPEDPEVDGYAYGEQGLSGELPIEVQEWAGLADAIPCVTWDRGGDEGPRTWGLATLNDEFAVTFPEIADLIDTQF